MLQGQYKPFNNARSKVFNFFPRSTFYHYPRDIKKKEVAFHIDFLCSEQNSVFGPTSETRAGPRAPSLLPGSLKALSSLSKQHRRTHDPPRLMLICYAQMFRLPICCLSAHALTAVEFAFDKYSPVALKGTSCHEWPWFP